MNSKESVVTVAVPPAGATLGIVRDDLLKLIERGAGTNDLRRYLERVPRGALSAEIDYVGPNTRQAGHRAYDAAIDEILITVMRATSREGLVDQIFASLIDENIGSPLVALCVLDGIASTDGSLGAVRLGQFHGVDISARVWEAFRDELPRLAQSPIIPQLLFEKHDIELWMSSHIIRYRGEFDHIMSAAGKQVKDGYWISAIALPSERPDLPNRSLIGLYQNLGTLDAPLLPSGANRDWRIFRIASKAYQLLGLHLAGIADQLTLQRRALINSIAPGLMHHEIGALMQNQVSLLDVAAVTMDRIIKNRKVKLGDFKALAKDIKLAIGTARKLYNITSAFNNLERRAAMNRFDLIDVLKEVEELTAYRLKNAGIGLNMSKVDSGLAFVGDRALLLHAVLNIVVNASDALKESPVRMLSSSGRSSAHYVHAAILSDPHRSASTR